jgi:hypothetical protein
MDMNDGIHYERDSRLIPYLLACEEIKFVGTSLEGKTVYFGFTPKSKALQLIDQYFLNQSPHIPAKKLFDAIDEFRVILHREKNNRGIS